MFFAYKKTERTIFFSTRKKMDTDDEQLIDSFTTNDETSDIVLIVDEKKIYAHKSILGKIIVRRI